MGSQQWRGDDKPSVKLAVSQLVYASSAEGCVAGGHRGDSIKI